MKHALKNLKKHLKHLKKRKHKIGYTASAALFFGLGMFLAQNEMLPQGGEKFQPPQEEEMMAVEDFVDPREIENTLRNIAQLKGEVKGLLKRAGKTSNLNEGLTSILAELSTYTKNIQNHPPDYTVREALQEFYDARMWEEVGKFRAQIELPRILKEIPMQLRRVEQLLKLKTYQRIGIDMTSMKNSIQEMRDAYTSAQNNYKEGNFEEAMQALEFMNESGRPGEIEGAMRQLKEFNDRIRTVKDREINAELMNLLVPITEAINEGDFRFANEMLNDTRPHIMTVMKQVYKMNAKTRTNILKQLSSFENKITDTLETHQDQKIKREENKMNQDEQGQHGERESKERGDRNGIMPGIPPEFGEKKGMPLQPGMPPFEQGGNKEGGAPPPGASGTTTAPYPKEPQPPAQPIPNQPSAGATSPSSGSSEPYNPPPANTTAQ